MENYEKEKFLTVEEKLFYDELRKIRQSLDSLIKGKSQRFRDCVGKVMVIENDTGQIKGEVLTVDNHWIEIEWKSESAAEDKSGITAMAIDSITAFCLAIEDNGQTS